jgi:hydroxymethylpyrimidine pyrophosphatase-like HAD family hydrolase
MPVIIVTGRPAGWGHALMTLVPLPAVVTENGGVSFVRNGRRLDRIYGVPEDSLPDWRRRMHAAADEVMLKVPGTRLSTDSRYREVDLAIVWNEEASLPVTEAERAATLLRASGFSAWRSSVHVNFSPPAFDKLSACKDMVERVLGGNRDQLAPYVYVGDALNDAPMFGGFPNSVGVANVRDWWDELQHTPRFVTDAREGAGFRELAAHLRGLARE